MVLFDNVTDPYILIRASSIVVLLSNSRYRSRHSKNFSNPVFIMKTGFEKFLECLDLYLELLNNPTIDETQIRIYGSVTLSNGAIVRATSNFHNREWFSEVAISMSSEESDDYTLDQEVCYGQVIYMFKVIY